MEKIRLRAPVASSGPKRATFVSAITTAGGKGDTQYQMD